jgi:hypothetical protein
MQGNIYWARPFPFYKEQFAFHVLVGIHADQITW